MNSPLPRALHPESSQREAPHSGRSNLRSLGSTPLARLEHRIAALRAEVAAAERKRAGIEDAIASRRKTLNRLQAHLILERGVAPSRDE